LFASPNRELEEKNGSYMLSMSTAGEKDCSRPDFRAASLKFLKIVAGLRGAFCLPKISVRVVFFQ